MTQEPTLNIPLLRKAVEWVEAEAAKPIKDSQWYQPGVVTDAAILDRDCGTCFCVAGWVAAQVSDKFDTADDYRKHNESAIAVAEDALGLRVTHFLFEANNTITDVRRIAEELAGEAL